MPLSRGKPRRKDRLRLTLTFSRLDRLAPSRRATSEEVKSSSCQICVTASPAIRACLKELSASRSRLMTQAGFTRHLLHEVFPTRLDCEEHSQRPIPTLEPGVTRRRLRREINELALRQPIRETLGQLRRRNRVAVDGLVAVEEEREWDFGMWTVS